MTHPPGGWPPTGPQPIEGIALSPYYPPLYGLAAFTPKVIIDGAEFVLTSWARTVIAAPPGRRHVHVHIPYLTPRQLGSADVVVDVYPGQLVELEYKSPLWPFSAGALGPAPQRYQGVARMFTMIGAVGVLMALFLIMLNLPSR